MTRADGSLTASWPAVASATRYHVTYRAEGGDWALAALGHTATSIVIGGVDDALAYVVGVRAGNGAGWSGWTNSATVSPAAPDAPESVTVTGRDDGSAEIAWTPVEGATSYAIAQSADNGQTWANAQTTGAGGGGAGGASGGGGAGAATTATIGGLINSETYIFGVSAVNASGASAQTNSAPAPPVEPGPATVTVTRATGGTLTASWDALPNIWNYFVKYSGDRVNWAYSGLIGKGTSHTFTGLDDTQTYTVAVRGLVDYGWTAWTYSAPAGGPSAAPAAPRNLTTTRTEVSANYWTLRVDWDDVPFATLYDVELSTDNGATWTRESTGLSSSTVSKSLSSGDDDYKARVRARNTNGTSGWAVSAVDLAPNGPPAAPASVTVSRSGKTLTVSWTAVPFAAKYNLNTSDNGQVSWARAASGVTGVTTTLTVASATKDYYVSVQAENAAGTGGPWRDSAVSRAVALPPAPTGVTVVRDAAGEIDVSWTAVSGAVGYDLSCSDSGYYWGTCGNVSTTATSATFAHASIAESRTYTIAVRARNASGGGPWAKAWVAGVFIPHYVWKPAVLRRDSGTAVLSWEPTYAEHHPITHYRVYCAEGLTGTPVWTKCLDNMAAPSGQPVTVTGTVSGLDDTKAYRFGILSVNFVGDGGRRIPTSAVVAPGPPVMGQETPTSFTISAPARTGGGGQTLTYNIHCRVAGGEYTLAKEKWDPGVNPATVTLATVRSYTGCASFEGLIIESVNGIPGGRLYYPTASAITAITGARGNGSLTLTWPPPSTNPLRPVTGYDVECSTDGGATWADCGGSGSLSGSTYTYTVSSGVSNGAIHIARARARTSIGPAPWTESAEIAGWNTPSRIASITAARGSGSITLTWTVPSVPNSGGAISGYDVECAMKVGSTWRAWADCGGSGSATSGTYTYTKSDAVDANVYKARARARNSSGVGIWRESGDIHTVPGAPSIVAYSLSTGILAWKLPASADRGSGTAGYQYNVYCRSSSSASWSKVINGVTVPVGTYEQDQLTSLVLHSSCTQTASEVEVGFVNVYEGPRARYGPPAQIASVTLSRNTDGDSLTLSWAVPASGSFNPITGYEAECSTDAGTTWASCGGTIAASGAAGSARTHSFTVSKYKSYLVRLRATSSHPADTAWRQSASSAGQTLGAPQSVSVANSSYDGQTRTYPVSWSKPANTGTETFAYQVQCTNSDNPTSSSWNACGTHNVSATANANVNMNVTHGWQAGTFKQVRVRTSKDGVYSAWVTGDTQFK